MRQRLGPCLAAAAALLFAPALGAQPLDPKKPEDAIRIGQKTSCSTIDGKDALFWWHGNVYSRVPGERDRLLFKVQGFNVRACKAYSDPRRGPGYRSVSREMLVYFDKDSGELLRKWKNPWTGEEVEVLFVANDPVNAREPSYAYDKEGKPSRTGEGSLQKDGFVLNGGGAARLFYDNPLAGDYQKYIGGTYHAMEFGTGASPAADLYDPKATEVRDRVISWVRVSKWLPWMKMGDRAGLVMFHTAGLRLDSWDEVPEPLRSEVRNNWATFLKAPPTDDARPNMTSWEQFKRWKGSGEKH